MSHIGKQRILIPKNVQIKCIGWKLYAYGKHGKASIIFPMYTQLLLENNYLRIVAPHINPALYGSLQRKLKAIILGLSLIYVCNLQFVGLGYKAIIENDNITLRLGYSHDINVKIPDNLQVSLAKRNNLKITGSNFEEVRQFAYKVRSFRPPDPFKGKGIVCMGETVRRKEGKKKKI